jgi:ATP citrate (pro-S)-lyase
VYATLDDVPEALKEKTTWFFSAVSGRRTLEGIGPFFDLPHLLGGVIFAEKVPEVHAIELAKKADDRDIMLIGPASIGLLIPGYMKLGAIGGVEIKQQMQSGLLKSGTIAVISGSGGMTNEIMHTLARYGKRVSFAVSFGGDRYPSLTPEKAFLLAQEDSRTDTIVYYGELGGTDELRVAQLIHERKVTKKVIAYISGMVSEILPKGAQFGHAKAMARVIDETASAKRALLREAGVNVCETYAEFLEALAHLPAPEGTGHDTIDESMQQQIINRKKALFVSHLSGDKEGVPEIMHQELTTFIQGRSFGGIVMCMLLNTPQVSKDTEALADVILRLLVDHGPQVSGAVNSMIAARAGVGLVASLTAGLQTIGPRFGGAINAMAGVLLDAVINHKSSQNIVEDYARKGVPIPGIGHRKYRADIPDPRVIILDQYANRCEKKEFYDCARSIERITTQKKANLILNVDGMIAALMLDMLSEKEGYTKEELQKLVDIELLNALFILSRSVGFVAHALDQKRNDEGLFRLPDEDVLTV